MNGEMQKNDIPEQYAVKPLSGILENNE